MSKEVKVIKFDMAKLQADHGEAVRVKLGTTLTLVYQKNGTKKKEAIQEMINWAHAYPEYVLDWNGYSQPVQSKPQSKSNKESEMKTVTNVVEPEVIDVETVVVDEATTSSMSVADYKEFLEYQEFRAWKARQEREKFARRPIDQTPPRLEQKAVFAAPAPSQPEVKFVHPEDVIKAHSFIKENVAKTVHEVEKSYFMSCEWRGVESIAEDVTVDLSGLMQPVTEEQGLGIAKAAFDRALEEAMYDRFGSGWEYQLESAGIISPLKVSRIVGAVMSMMQ